VSKNKLNSSKNDHGAAPFEDSKLHHLIENTSYSIFDLVVYAQSSLCGRVVHIRFRKQISIHMNTLLTAGCAAYATRTGHGKYKESTAKAQRQKGRNLGRQQTFDVIWTQRLTHAISRSTRAEDG